MSALGVGHKQGSCASDIECVGEFSADAVLHVPYLTVSCDTPKDIDSLHRSQEYLPDNAVVRGRKQALAKYTISLQENVWVCSVRQALGADLSFAL